MTYGSSRYQLDAQVGVGKRQIVIDVVLVRRTLCQASMLRDERVEPAKCDHRTLGACEVGY
jgi:hypothetical protein